MLALIAAALLFATVAFSQQKNEDEVLYLPGLKDSLKFRHYAGYLTANSTNGRDLFYWFLESQRNPSKDPVVLWLNGGPVCILLQLFFCVVFVVFGWSFVSLSSCSFLFFAF